MGQTVKYCVQCLLALKPSKDTTDEDRLILSAMKSAMSGDPFDANYKVAEGLCGKCGKESVLIYYEIPDP
jgi:hypothetical protein